MEDYRALDDPFRIWGTSFGNTVVSCDNVAFFVPRKGLPPPRCGYGIHSGHVPSSSKWVFTTTSFTSTIAATYNPKMALDAIYFRSLIDASISVFHRFGIHAPSGSTSRFRAVQCHVPHDGVHSIRNCTASIRWSRCYSLDDDRRSRSPNRRRHVPHFASRTRCCRRCQRQRLLRPRSHLDSLCDGGNHPGERKSPRQE